MKGHTSVIQLALEVVATAELDGVPQVINAHGPVELLQVVFAQEVDALNLLRLRLLVGEAQVAAKPGMRQMAGQRIGREGGSLEISFTNRMKLE